MERYFVLDDRGEPVLEENLDAWTTWYERADRGVARATVSPDVTVLTVFTGVDTVNDVADARPFESHVFGGVLDGEVRLSSTRGDALASHQSLVEWCRIGNAPGGGVTAEDLV